MEFDIDKNKVIGIVGHELSGRSTRIRILSVFDSNNKIKTLPEDEIRELFPPKGFIFEPGFFHNYNYKENDIISFFIEELKNIDSENKDQHRLSTLKKQVNKYGIQARYINGVIIEKRTIDFSNASLKDNNPTGNFYGIIDKLVIGELRFQNEKILPALYHRVKVWDINESSILKCNNSIITLHEKPQENFSVYDCMDNQQLFEWFREGLKKVEPDYVKLLDHKAKWRNEIPKLFSESNKEKYEVDKTRFKRLEEKIKYLDLSISDIKTLIEKSNSLKRVFNDVLETHKKEWETDYKKQIEEYRKEFDKQKKLLDSELMAIQNSQKEKEAALNSLNKKIESSSKRLESINKNKERILADFSIIKDVLSIESNTGKPTKLSDSFILEDIKKPDDTTLFSSGENFVTEIKYQLNKHQLCPNFAKRLLDIFAIYKGIFIRDIELGIAFVNATNNARYIIQQVEPDWLHFGDFWNNGLGTIWQSAHKYPEKLHFLILEDINLSSPECYARPLFDIIKGIRNHIPYGKTAFPMNLKILAIKASTTDPEIGLPLIEQTFAGWGAVGFNDKLYEKSDTEYKSSSGIITSDTLSNFQLDEFEIENIKLAVKNEFNNLFGLE